MSDAADRAIERARRVTIRRYASAVDADREERAHWEQIPEAERAAEAVASQRRALASEG